MIKFVIPTTMLLLSCAATAEAADWPQGELDQAVHIVALREKDYLEECVISYGTSIHYESAQRDVNGDGINEIIVDSYPAELGNGVTGCYGWVGKHMYLTSKAKGTWEILVIGENTHDFVFHPRQPGEMPDVELIGPGFCFNVQRFHMGEYKLWKVCDGNRQLFADAAPWLTDMSIVAPRDAGGEGAAPIAAEPIEVSSSAAADLVSNREISDHNGSAMRVDPAEGTITYYKPKASIAGTIKPGTVLFQADAPWDPYDDSALIRGTAYVFKKGCEPAPYPVSGRHSGWHTITLKGAAPVREKSGCKVIGYKMNGNSTLKFESWGD